MGSTTPNRPQMEKPILKDGMKVRVPNNLTKSYLTKGKEYFVSEVCEHEFISFWITDDCGDRRFCLLKRCYHLRKRNWIIVKEYETRCISEKSKAVVFWSFLILAAVAIVRMAFLAVIYLFQGV
jgi:hypothetical protein